MRNEYSIQFLCSLMGVNRSGYYKWRKRQGKINQYGQKRQQLVSLLKAQHNRFPSYGYHRLAAVIRNETDLLFGDNLVHKCCRQCSIRSKIHHYKYKKTGRENTFYPNTVTGKWNAKRPLELVVSDMTILKHKGKLHEWVYVLDTFNNEIISHHLGRRHGDPRPYYQCLEDLKQKKDEQMPTILHTDQGAVYSSRAFAKAHEKYNIFRSMSLADTPTDNPIIESVNGWIKQEMLLDFDMEGYSDLSLFLDDFVRYYNIFRPAYALNYKSPIQFKIEQGF